MNWQLLLVLALCAGALAYLFQRIRRRFGSKKQQGCEKCGLSADDKA